mmetsp:Transcript_8438/g.4565  ORF Transcript_8438/g.4565 Transcript_8438/m.4565 type:complete len:83 (-) Transcript_8438:264-512(-)
MCCMYIPCVMCCAICALASSVANQNRLFLELYNKVGNEINVELAKVCHALTYEEMRLIDIGIKLRPGGLGAWIELVDLSMGG